MKLQSWKYFINQGIRGMCKNGIMSLASIVIVSACIFIVILSLCIIINLNYALTQIESDIGITLFLGDQPTDEQVTELKSVLENMDDVVSVSYFSSEDALEEAKTMYGSDALEGLKEENPLPRSLVVKLAGIKYQKDFIKVAEQLRDDFEQEIVNGVKTGYMENAIPSAMLAQAEEPASEESSQGETQSETATEAPTQAETSEQTTGNTEIGGTDYSYKGIERIRHAEVLTDYFLTINTAVKIISSALIIILCIIAVGIIMNTIKLTVFVRKTEIGIMKYVGATDWFIRWPFIVEGVVIGLIGAVIPIVICWLAYARFEIIYVTDWSIIANTAKLKTGLQIFSIVGPISILVGALLGAVGSITAIRRHLNV
jgi:cell division transport system permease protein